MNIKHKKFGYNSATQLANNVIELFYGLGNSYGFSFFEFWKENRDELIEKLVKPRKDTALHTFIKYVEAFVYIDVYEELSNIDIKEFEQYFDFKEAMIRGADYDLKFEHPDYNEISECSFCGKCLDCIKLDNNVKELNKAQDNILLTVIDTTFHLLMVNKPFLCNFNERLADYIEEDIEYLKVKYQTFFDKNGRINRVSYWPMWLRKGLFYRDRGVCVICRKDLSGIINLGFNYEIDHIVPISKFGNNDPSNLQVLCKNCNTKKLNMSNQISTYEIPFWNKDDE